MGWYADSAAGQTTTFYLDCQKCGVEYGLNITHGQTLEEGEKYRFKFVRDALLHVRVHLDNDDAYR